MAPAAPKKDRPKRQSVNWGRVAIARDTDPATRRRAWKVLLYSSAACIVALVTLHFVIPPLSWLGVGLLWVGVAIFIGLLAWWTHKNFE